MKKVLLFIALFFVIQSCTNENDISKETEQLAVSFNSYITEDLQTRATGTTWESGDKIGVYAIKNNAILVSENIINNYENLPFSTKGNGVFYAESRSIYYPEDETPMDFVAYYPFDSAVENYACPIDITEQTDFFYSNNAKAVVNDGITKTLEFQRVLSKVLFTITPTNNSSLDKLSIVVNNANTKANFSLVNGTLSIDTSSKKALTINTTGDANKKKAEILFLPTVKSSEISVTFKVGDSNIYTWKIPHQLEKGKVYSYNIKLDKNSTVVTRPKDYMEIPCYTSSTEAPDSYRATHMIESLSWLNASYTGTLTRNYSILFDTKNRLPYWIAYPMHPMYLKSGNRTDDWGYDPKIPRKYQPNLRKGWTDRTYNRGHMLASADRNATSVINRTTFYYTNMVAQNVKMNGGTWNDLEQKERKWCMQSQYDTLYVVTGAILPKSPENIQYTTDIDGRRSAIPKYLYKALLRKNKSTGKYFSVGFKMENKNTGISYRNSVVSVEELEKETGFTFFPDAPDAESVKKQKDLSLWN